MIEHRKIGALLVLALMIPGLASAARVGRLIGKIVDPAGEPIEGVVVTATSPDISSFREVTTTNQKGIFRVDFDELNVVYEYRFEAAGYQTAKANQHWTFEGTKRHEFTLHPGASADPGAAPPASTSSDAIAAFNLGGAALEAEDYVTATVKFEEALDHDPELRQAWEALSVVHLEMGRHREAAETAEKALGLGSNSISVLRARWDAYRGLGDEEQAARAMADLERVGELTEEAKRIYNEGVTLSKAGDLGGGFAKFQEALAADPNQMLSLVAVATTGLQIDRVPEAIAAAETILEADRQHEQALRIRYNGWLKLGDVEKVTEALVDLAPIDPVLARDNLFKMARLAFDADETANAQERFDLVLGLDPNHAQSHYYLGLISMREGANDDATSRLERFLELAPDHPNAGTARELLAHLAQS